MIRIGIDPGVHECGVAIEWGVLGVDGGTRLIHAAFIVRADESLPVHMQAVHMAKEIARRALSVAAPVRVCIESQQVYRSERSKGDPADLIKLAHVGGVVLGALAMGAHHSDLKSALPLPRQWKGGIPKEKHHPRLARDFPHWVGPVESDTIPSLQNHVWDAVGLLEWHRERSET